MYLRAVVEVIPMVASADPVVIGGGIVGLVVGVSGGVVQLAGLGVLASGLGVQGGGGLTVEGLEHLCGNTNIRNITALDHCYLYIYHAQVLQAITLTEG